MFFNNNKYFNSAIRSRSNISIFYWSHVFTWCEFTGQSSPNFNKRWKKTN